MVSVAKKVAVIGAGVSGLTSARHLKAAGLEVVVFERSSVSGGLWTYIEQKPRDPNFPSLRPSVADFVGDSSNDASSREKKSSNGFDVEQISLDHGPPGPAYKGLINNIPLSLQVLKGCPWKEGLEEYVNVREIGNYLHDYSEQFGIESEIKFNTRVERVEKPSGAKRWLVSTSTLIKDGPDAGKKTKQTEEFDAVVVANGHYHACNVPDIPGLREWKSTWPSRVQHSKTYREPHEFKDQNVLLIGTGVSSTDIAKEIAPFAGKIYQSSRDGILTLPASMLPPTAERVADISSFTLPSTSNDSSGTVTLVDGRVLNNINRVVVATGYHITVPFLPSLHDDNLATEQADDKILVTDGSQFHNLHKDIFYIPDPTLAVVGAPFHICTFTLFEMQAIAVSKVFSGQAWVPSEGEMRKEYNERVQQKGYGRAFHSLMGVEVPYVASLVEWVNSQIQLTGGEKMEGHTEAFLEGYATLLPRIKEVEAGIEAKIKAKKQEALDKDVLENGKSGVDQRDGAPSKPLSLQA